MNKHFIVDSFNRLTASRDLLIQFCRNSYARLTHKGKQELNDQQSVLQALRNHSLSPLINLFQVKRNHNEVTVNIASIAHSLAHSICTSSESNRFVSLFAAVADSIHAAVLIVLNNFCYFTNCLHHI